jgi:hypothetical protein
MANDLAKILKTIFSDCVAIDVDFPKWDKYISIVVVADYMGRSKFNEKQRPIYKM